MIYDCLKNKLLASIQPAGKIPSFKVDWNPLDTNFILMGSQTGKSYIIYCLDLKNLQVTSQVEH